MFDGNAVGELLAPYGVYVKATVEHIGRTWSKEMPGEKENRELTQPSMSKTSHRRTGCRESTKAKSVNISIHDPSDAEEREDLEDQTNPTAESCIQNRNFKPLVKVRGTSRK
ncbi:unnamed protein product [Acanthoscelides obtectus]|uniref:Uncharacterized protein n=1 Tax=Acanthoscelides obtectus TaxID=200917 RepID=A0A9P0QAC4_ACAOB|nr:unnamed protein product [Acanthoscelides obtectus]CAK1652078.1 hypothetical protein AOBTE_LOCUS17665 [Acanthoscelides obtectus]